MLVLSACASSLPPDPCAQASTDFDSFVARWPVAVCNTPSAPLRAILQRDLGYWPFDCAAELADAEGEGRFARLRDAVAAGSVTFRGDAAAACLCALERVPRLAMPRACADVFVGDAPEGARCTYDEECAGGACIGGSRLTCSGRCGPGGAAAGAPCAIYADCGRPDGRLFCAGTACAYRADLGDPCVLDGCMAGSACDPVTQRCIADRGPVAGLGEPCDLATCTDGLACVDEGSGLRCGPVRTDGTCRMGIAGDCPPGTRCTLDSGRLRCTANPYCGDGFCIHGLRCDWLDGPCHALHHLTYTCGADTHCLSGACGPVSQCVTPPACE